MEKRDDARPRKRLIIIGGTMGAGKTATCRELQKLLPKNVFLDGDWCWDANPFVVNDETKEMVLGNIAYMLQSFLDCSAYENVIFCWVLHERQILRDLLSRLDTSGAETRAISLILTPEALERRLRPDIERGVRGEDIIERSVARLPLYAALDTEKLDVSDISAAQAAEHIACSLCSSSAGYGAER